MAGAIIGSVSRLNFRESESLDEARRRTVMLGLVFLLCLVLAYFGNISFFNYLGYVFSNPILAVLLVFVHNVLAVSLILLGMTFYVGVVLTFMPKRKIEYVVLQRPRVFAFVFTAMIIFISILRTSMLLRGHVLLNTLALVILLSTPIAIIEGYGIFQTIDKTLKRKMTLKRLAAIYSIFFVAAVIEVGYVQLLPLIS